MVRSHVRSAEPRDADAIALLSGQLGYTADAGTTAGRLAVLAERGGNAVFVAEDVQGKVLGWAHVFAAYRLESPPFAELGGLVVAGKKRGQGVGRALVVAAESWARAQGLTGMRVRSNVVREAAHGFYCGLGYAEIKNQAVFHKKLGLDESEEAKRRTEG